MRCKCASSVMGAYAVFSSFLACCIVASQRAYGIVSRVIHGLRVPLVCLHRCFWMHVLRYPCSVCSFQLQEDRFWAWAEDTPLEEEEEEEEDEFSSSSSSSSSSASASASASGSVRAPTPEKKAARSTVLEKEKEKHKEKEKDKDKEKEKEPEAEGEAVGQQKQELAAAAQDAVVVEGAKGKERKAKEGKPKGKENGREKGKEKAGGVGNVGLKIEGAVGPQKSMPAKTTRFEHYKESTQFMNDMQVLFTSHALCFACLRQCFQRRSPRYACDPRAGSLLRDMLLDDMCMWGGGGGRGGLEKVMAAKPLPSPPLGTIAKPGGDQPRRLDTQL